MLQRLLHLMDANDVQPADLVDVFGSSDRVLEVIDGKRSIDLAVTTLDERFDEERFITIGLDALGRVLVVVYTWRDREIRLISARSATRQERRQYEDCSIMEVEHDSVEVEYDFSQGKRGAIDPIGAGKTRITIRIDDDVLDWFRDQIQENRFCVQRRCFMTWLDIHN
jgi:uncharacterized DUF497 family protein